VLLNEFITFECLHYCLSDFTGILKGIITVRTFLAWLHQSVLHHFVHNHISPKNSAQMRCMKGVPIILNLLTVEVNNYLDNYP